MEEDKEEFFEIDEPIESAEINDDFEFDAPQFYEFNRPETDWEAAEAELWFVSAGNYLPSPFAIKLKQRCVIVGGGCAIPSSVYDGDGGSATSTSNASEIRDEPEVPAIDYDERGLAASSHLDAKSSTSAKTKSKSQVKSSLSRSSTLMKPTASHLAKQNQSREIHFEQQLRRFEKLVAMFDDKSSKCSSLIDGHPPKRQKLEAGYLSKAAHLKHQVSFVHKTSKKDGSFGTSHRVTVPREPELETARRALSHSSKIKEESKGDSKDARVFKAQPLNRKILKAPTLTLPKRSIPQLPHFQEFHLRTSERAKQHASNKATKLPNYVSTSRNEVRDPRRLNSCIALKERHDGGHKACPLSKKGFKLPADTGPMHEPPTELFNKLSLSSDVQPDVALPSRKVLTNKDVKVRPSCSKNHDSSGDWYATSYM
ncbi:hypothetical protein SLE2022_371360 [Rubroshorea leprosula]